MSEHSSDHASSFHITDRVYLDYRPVEEKLHTPDWRHDTSHFCDTLIKLREISLQSSHILASIRKKNPDVGHYLALLDKKVDLLSQLVGDIKLGGELAPTHEVALGAEDIRFVTPDKLLPNEHLHLKVVLFPSHLCLQLRARVAQSEIKADGNHVKLEFEQIGETEHEALIRHLLEKQSAMLREQREHDK